ncbi:MAG: nuclear transport factor 2 family protein [Marinobacter adhaerens]|uniref:Nuclear transport factor 2 family protein n=1 Tax=Marinobacter adhaerens TaxID=1033846 RepID=A0A844I640_9GAMM|nr:nuclear transport factor 2 family protein [Marinobacter adhaerens]
MKTAQTQLEAMVNEYFQGLHTGNAERLAPLFHRDCVLKAPGLRRTLDEWLADVATRPIPANIGHPEDYRILRVELAGNQAMVKVACPLPHGDFTDYLGFLREDGVWKIVNKMYAPATA